jgi:hypothetical protein
VKTVPGELLEDNYEVEKSYNQTRLISDDNNLMVRTFTIICCIIYECIEPRRLLRVLRMWKRSAGKQ